MTGVQIMMMIMTEKKVRDPLSSKPCQRANLLSEISADDRGILLQLPLIPGIS